LILHTIFGCVIIEGIVHQVLFYKYSKL